MPKPNYSNLSVESKRYYKIRRSFDSNSETDLTFSGYVVDVVEKAVEREKFLKKAYPNLKIVRITKKEIVIEDTEKNEFVKVYQKGNEIVSSNQNPIYTRYALLHPEFSIST